MFVRSRGDSRFCDEFAVDRDAVDPDSAAALFNHIYSSDLYRPDQHSFMLYPDRKLKGFMERNCIPEYRRDAAAVEFCPGWWV